MLTFDPEYFYRIHRYIQGDWIPEGGSHKLIPGEIYEIASLTGDPDKLLFHLMYYIDCTANPPHVGWKHIELIDPIGSGNYTQFKVLELGLINKMDVFIRSGILPDGVKVFLSKHPYRNYIF